MRIQNVSIRRFRVFDTQVDIALRGLTVLTGPNNLGKSTVLSALALFFNGLASRAYLEANSRVPAYSTEVDYPKCYEGRVGRRWPTQIRIQFALDEDERREIAGQDDLQVPALVTAQMEFKLVAGLQRFRPHTSILEVEFEIGERCLEWIRHNVRYVYIPAARNVEEFRRNVFSELLSGAIHRVSRSTQRIQAMQRLYDDVLAEVSELQKELAEDLRKYLPDVKELKFLVSELALERLVTVRDVEIDDGANTTLQQKGDGFKSLFSMSVLQFMARRRHGKNLVFGIEEPEAHLHSSAIYSIKETLRELSKSFQIAITTHSPILIQRDDIRANIIVEHAGGADFTSKASSARTLAQIRRSLGIRPQENMTTAEVVLVVEGATEERVLPSILGRLRSELVNDVSAGRVRVLSANSAANIPAVVRALARDATNCLVLVDADAEGLRAADQVRNSGLLRATDVFQVTVREGCLETEFEDLFDPALYLEAVCHACGIVLSVDDFERLRAQTGNKRTKCAKWSGVMTKAANGQSRNWDTVADEAKAAFANSITSKMNDIPVADLLWAKAIAMQVSAYLREEQAAG